MEIDFSQVMKDIKGEDVIQKAKGVLLDFDTIIDSWGKITDLEIPQGERDRILRNLEVSI